VEDLKKHGADVVIMGEREIARGMLEHVLGSAAGQLAQAEGHAGGWAVSREGDSAGHRRAERRQRHARVGSALGPQSYNR